MGCSAGAVDRGRTGDKRAGEEKEGAPGEDRHTERRNFETEAEKGRIAKKGCYIKVGRYVTVKCMCTHV